MNYLEIFWLFFKIGLFTFGGGYAMIPIIRDTFVSRGWITFDEMIDFIGVSESTPGPFAINIATFIGNTHLDILGGLCATLGVILPSFIIIVLITKFFPNFMDNSYVKSALTIVKPIIVGLILGIIITLFYNVSFKSGFDYKAIMIVIIIFVLSRFKKVHPIYLIVLSAILGLGLYAI